MKKRLLKVLTLSVLFALSTTVFPSCGDDDEDEIPSPTPENPENTEKPNNQDNPENPNNQDNPENPNNQDNPENPDPLPELTTSVFILNEGSMGHNDAKLDLYRPQAADNKFSGGVFAEANGIEIGDTGQDLVRYGNNLYLSVNGSMYIAKIDLNTLKLVEKYEFSEQEGAPRQLVATGGYVYVSLYSGQVARFDTTSISNPQFVTVGSNPEGMAVKGSQLLVCNSGWGKDNRLSVIDLATFTLNRNIELVNNLQSVAAAGDSVYVTYYDESYTIRSLVVDLSKDIFYSTNNVTKMAVVGDQLFCANSVTIYDKDWNPTIATNFYVKDTKTGKINNNLIEQQYATELAESTVYLFEIDPLNGDIYVGISDHVTNGEIYRFDKDGKLIEKFSTSGINPSHAVFVK